jgi:cytochrome c oxidase assembly protein subunit 15
MLLDVRQDQAPTLALHEPRPVAGERFGNPLASVLGWHTPARMRAALATAAAFGLVAFLLAAGNRLTSGPWFLYPPEVSLLPPFGRAAWQHAFVLHQQSPLYALCGGYDVGGMESITIFKFLYWWEWSRIASVVLLAASLFAAWLLFLFGAAKSERRLDPWPALGLLSAGVAYVVLRYFADRAGLFAIINIGQQRHALDITFASVALAMLIVPAISPARLEVGSIIPRVTWGAVIALDIAFGALFEAMDAGALWTTFPGYTDGLLPNADRLFAFHPIWRNLTENGYLIQACHRVLSMGLWAAALIAVLAAISRGRPSTRALVLFGLLTLEGALGVAALQPGQPVVLSIAHQLCAIAVLTAALAPRGRAAPRSASAVAA